jgi:hypothetical protein
LASALDRLSGLLNQVRSAEARQQLARLGRELARVGGTAAKAAASGLGAFWRLARPWLLALLRFLLALLVLFEEWGWRPLADLLGRLARFKPVAALEAEIGRLPPYAALFVFALPTGLLLPLKFLALLLIGSGHLVLAALLFAAAKLLATALIARLFLLTQPALMRIGWFAAGYERLMPWKEALLASVRETGLWRAARLAKARVHRFAVLLAQRMSPTLAVLRAAARREAEALLRWVLRFWEQSRTRP